MIEPSPYVAAILSKDAALLWSSPEGQELVALTHKHQRPLLARYFRDWCLLATLTRKLDDMDDQFSAEMKGQGFVQTPEMKELEKTEKRLREAEGKLGITLKDLDAGPTEEDNDAPSIA